MSRKNISENAFEGFGKDKVSRYLKALKKVPVLLHQTETNLFAPGL